MSVKIPSQEDSFELQLVRQDLLSDALFLIGTLISINQNKKAEQEIINPGENEPSGIITDFNGFAPFGFGFIVLALFLLGTGINAYTAAERLNRQKAEAGNNPDQTTANNIRGGEIIILGQLIRIIGYTTSILGDSIKNANPV